MDFSIRTPSKFIVTVAILSLMIPLAAFTPVSATGGTVQLSVQIPAVGGGTIPGTIENPMIFQSNNSVSMLMTVEGSIPILGGLSSAHVKANGMLSGMRNGADLSGPVQDVVGNATSVAGTARFVGQGQWKGSLSGSHGTGTLNVTITFTNSPVPQIQVNTPYPTTGTWSADFSMPVPEFGSALPTFMIMLTIATFLLLRIREPKQLKGRERRSR
jgi:hypothetical protein